MSRPSSCWHAGKPENVRGSSRYSEPSADCLWGPAMNPPFRPRILPIASLIVALIVGATMSAQQTQLPPAEKKYPYPPVRDMRGVIPPGPKVGPYNSPPLADGPFDFETYEQRNIRVAVVTKGLSHPWSIAFLPDGAILITERTGRLRIVRGTGERGARWGGSGVLDPSPVAGTPPVHSQGTMAGLMDIA